MNRPNTFLLVSLGLVIGLGLGFLVAEEKASNLRTKAKSAQVLAKESKSLAESCSQALDKTLIVRDQLYKVTNLLVDIVWDWSCSEILELKSTPKPTLEESPGEVIVTE